MTDSAPQGDASPVPRVDERTEPFWSALAEGRLVLRRCAVCSTLSHPVAPHCRRCESPQLTWADVEPRGTLFSWTVEGRGVIPGMTPPYVVAQLTPDGCEEGGVRVVGTLLTDAPDELHLGMPLVVSAAPLPGTAFSVLVLEPA